MDTIVGQGEKNLVQITVDTTGLRPFWSADEGLKKPASPLRPKRGVIIATDAHPFWVAGNLNRWVNASDLKPGMWLRTSAGTYVQVTATKHWTTHRQRVHNLTVADLHTYYVLAGTTPAPVHNDNEIPGWAANEIARKPHQGRESARHAAKWGPHAESGFQGSPEWEVPGKGDTYRIAGPNRFGEYSYTDPIAKDQKMTVVTC